MTECNGCGSCCENIYLSSGWDMVEERALSVDPREDWPAWVRRGWKRPEEAERIWLEARFIFDHWHLNVDAETYGCDVFDEATRSCGDYENRPPVCRGYPWYGKPPSMVYLHPDCSFRADQPPRVPVSLRRSA
jgi:Fe-S-cluster containining protein